MGRAPHGRDRAHDRPLRRDASAHVAHESRKGQGAGRPRVPARPLRRRGRDRRLHAARARGARPPGGGHARPDRGRRHALLRRPHARGGRPRRGDPEDDGQRRLRHGLLHRVLHGGDAQRRIPEPAARARRLPRADRGGRALRPQLGRDRADLRLPGRHRSCADLRGPVRHRAPRRAGSSSPGSATLPATR